MEALVGHPAAERATEHLGGRRLAGGLTLVPVLIGGALFGAGALDLLGVATFWDHLLRVLATVFALALVLHGWRSGRGRERRVRFWIAAALWLWLASELGRLANVAVGLPPQVGVDPTIIGLGLVGAATYVLAVHGRLRPSDEAALYLDAATIFATMVAIMLVVGGNLVAEPAGLSFLLHGAFLLAMVGATAVLALTMRVPRRLQSQYPLLGGLLLGGIGYVGLVFTGAEGVSQSILHAALAAGSVMVGYGGRHWTADEEADPRAAALSDRLGDALPMVAIAAAPLLTLALAIDLGGSAGPLRVPAAGAVALVVLLAVARQTILLRDREQSVDRERGLRDELAVAEAQYRSVVERVQGVVYVADVGIGARWHYVSHSIGDLLGFTPEEWLADPEQVARTMAETGMDPARLLVELTEGTLAAAGEGAEVELAEVSNLGVRIALDDFGSGYSSLEYLGRLPIDVLKVDRSLVARVDVEPQRQGVLRALGRIAADLGLETIVEGVERPAQRRVLLDLGFTQGQGFLFSRPVSLQQALAYGASRDDATRPPARAATA